MSFRSYPDAQYLKELMSQDEVLYDTYKPSLPWVSMGWEFVPGEAPGEVRIEPFTRYIYPKEPDRPDHNTKFVYEPPEDKYHPDSVSCA